MIKRFIVVGASAASIAFITKLRSFDKESEIICISGEKDIPYNRCFLADFVSQDKSLQDLYLKPDNFFEDNSIDLRLNTWVTKIDTHNNCVYIGKEQVSYDYLFLGIGKRPFIPPVTGDLQADGIFTFHTADEVQKISAYIDKHKPVNAVVVGAGINGVECASSLHERGVAVSLVERAGQILPLQVDTQTAAYVTAIIQHKGLGLFLEQSVSGLCTVDGKVAKVDLDSGTSLPTDMVIFATGSITNSDLLQGTDIVLDKGSIVVDATMKTSVDNVYAAGDIVTYKDMVTGNLVKSATWSDAMLQGLCAATQFSQRSRVYPGIIGLRDSYFFNHPFYACGTTVGNDKGCRVITEGGADSLTKLYLQDKKLQGFVLIGDISKVAEYKQKYLTQQDFTE